jgi:hypothetical protein
MEGVAPLLITIPTAVRLPVWAWASAALDSSKVKEIIVILFIFIYHL